MTVDFKRMIAEATRLTRAGDLRGATAAIQTALRGHPAAPAPAGETDDRAVIDVQARELADEPTERTPVQAPPSQIEEVAEGRFTAGCFAGTNGVREYKLYIPPQAAQEPLPLVVMLHGCTQNPEDFAAGTAMNDIAMAQGFYVLYPAQSRQANPQGCWNWFKHSHQQRGRGEPALLAGMTRDVMATHAIDPGRVYVAGLSAGGAMAAILGAAYPELFAAVGVHSGLAAGAASDLTGALMAMRGASLADGAAPHGVPTIVFHGDADSTVHPSNGAQVIRASVGESTSVTQEEVPCGAGRRATRQIHRTADGRIVAEHWNVHGSGHAWSGGSAEGSYTDALGPSASAAMVHFFFEHAHQPQA